MHFLLHLCQGHNMRIFRRALLQQCGWFSVKYFRPDGRCVPTWQPRCGREKLIAACVLNASGIIVRWQLQLSFPLRETNMGERLGDEGIRCTALFLSLDKKIGWNWRRTNEEQLIMKWSSCDRVTGSFQRNNVLFYVWSLVKVWE